MVGAACCSGARLAARRVTRLNIVTASVAIGLAIMAAATVTLTRSGDAVERGSRSLVAAPPSAPALTTLKRPVTLRWTKSKGATTYLITRNGGVVATVAANPSSLPTQTLTVRIPCTGNTLSTLRVVARNSGGKSAPSKPSSWRC